MKSNARISTELTFLFENTVLSAVISCHGIEDSKAQHNCHLLGR